MEAITNQGYKTGLTVLWHGEAPHRAGHEPQRPKNKKRIET